MSVMRFSNGRAVDKQLIANFEEHKIKISTYRSIHSFTQMPTMNYLRLINFKVLINQPLSRSILGYACHALLSSSIFKASFVIMTNILNLNYCPTVNISLSIVKKVNPWVWDLYWTKRTSLRAMEVICTINYMDLDVNTRTTLNTKGNSKMDFSMV